MSIGVLFAFVISPMHDEMDAHSLEKDIIIQTHLHNHTDDKIKKFNSSIQPVAKSLLQASFHELDQSKSPIFIFSFSAILNSLSSTILLL